MNHFNHLAILEREMYSYFGQGHSIRMIADKLENGIFQHQQGTRSK